jgi:anaerobic selenocysteine-containing dehydrogenase
MRELRTTCTRDCPDSCGILAAVDEGRVIGHRGDPAHGVTRGFLCARGNEYLRRFADPSRLLHPLRRTAGGWERLTWDDALDLVAARLDRCRADLGPRAVLAVSYSGIHSWVPRILARLFWGHFGGGTFTTGGLSVEAVHAAQALDFGGDCTHAPEDLAHGAAFVVWGKNVAVTRPHVMPFIKQARTRGAPLVVIDPVRCQTTRAADAHHQLRPGTDAALARAVGRLLLERGAVDESFVAAHTSGLEGYRRLVMGQTLAEAARVTDLTPAAIESLAELYAARRPLATLVGLGPSYWRHGAAAVRLIDALAALSGNLGVPGGGVQTDINRVPGALDLAAMRAAPRGERREILLPRLGAEIQAAKDPPLRVGFVAGANPAATAPDTGRVAAGLRGLDFLVVVEQFMTATAALADVVLPCTTYLEMDDLVTAYGHTWLGATQAVVPPCGEARTDGAILQGLAARLGFGDALAGTPGEILDRVLAPLRPAGVTLAALRDAPRPAPGVCAVPFADRRFGTPSGRFELTQEAPPAPPPLAAGELHLVATKTLHMVNAQAQDEHLPAEPVVRLHPEALAARGLADGAAAAVVSPVGRVAVRVAADPAVRRDVLLFNPTRWRGELAGVNQLREAVLTDLGHGAAMHETRVRLLAAE